MARRPPGVQALTTASHRHRSFRFTETNTGHHGAERWPPCSGPRTRVRELGFHCGHSYWRFIRPGPWNCTLRANPLAPISPLALKWPGAEAVTTAGAVRGRGDGVEGPWLCLPPRQ